MIRCPDLNNEKRREAFNTILERLGGKPLGEGDVAERQGYLEGLTAAQRAAYHRAHYLFDKHPTMKAAHALLDSMDRLREKVGKTVGETQRPAALFQDKRGAYIPETSTIALLKNADLTTFLHELGHHFLEMTATRASVDTAPEAVKGDFNTLLKWFGVRDIQDWHNLGMEEKRSYHEKFAESFEHYLLEGKAPSLELQPVFSRIKTWMLAAYRSVKDFIAGHPQAGELSPEVRQVFDRLLASQDQIERAEQVRSYAPLFKDADEAGVPPTEFQSYMDAGQQATSDAVDAMQAKSVKDMRWLTGAQSRALKAVQKEAAGKRMEIRGDVAKEVWSQPVYQAWQFLTGRENLEGETSAKPVPSAGTGAVDSSKDGLLKAIGKLGGIKKDELVSEWGYDPKSKPESGVFGKPVVRAKEGRSLDDMAKVLADHGYLPQDYDLNDFYERFMRALGGSPEHSVYADADLLKGEQRPDVSEYRDRPGGRLNSDVVMRMGEPGDAEKLATLKMTRAGALDPDIVAEMFGFDSGDQLVRALANAQKPRDMIEAATDQRMLEQHGEMATPEARARAAEEAIHNEARARFMATGLKILTKSPMPARQIAEAAKEVAEATIADKRVRDLRPLQYTAAETKANREALHLAPKDPAGAADAQRAALLNNRLAKAALDAVNDVQKGIAYLRKFDKPSKRIDLEYREQIDGLLSQYGLSNATNKALDRTQSLRDWYASQIDMGNNPDIPDHLMDQMATKNYREMTVGEFRGLTDAVRSIEHLGRLKQTLQDGAAKRDFNEVVNEAVDNMSKLPQRSPESNRGLSKIDRKWLGAKGLVRSADASLLKMEQMFDWLDDHNSNGTFNRVAFRRIADAGVKESDLRNQIAAKLKETYALLPEETQRDWDRKVEVPELMDSKTGKPAVMLKSEIISMALNSGNESNFTKMLAGEKWSRYGVLQALSRTLSGGDIDFVNGIGRTVETLWPEIVAMERRLGNAAPPKVAGRALPLKNGTIEGFYYPVVYDPLRSYDVELNRQRSADSLFENNYTRATTQKGHTIARVENYARPLLLSMDVLPRHLNGVIHDLAYREAVMDADRFLSNKSVREGVEGALGREYYTQLRPWLKGIAGDRDYDQAALAFWDKAAHWARTSSTMVGLGYRLSTMLIHGTSAASNSIGELGAKWFGSGLHDFVGTPQKMADSKDFVFERSGEMRNRMNQVDRDMREQLRELELKSDTGPLGAVRQLADNARRFAYYGISMLDMASALPTWLGAYNKAMAHAADGGLDMAEQDAVYFADKSVRNAHGGGGIKDSTAVQRGTEAQKLFTMFYSFWSHFYNRQRDIARIAGGIPEQVKQGDYQGARRDFAMVLARSWFYFIVPQLLHAYLKPPPLNQDKEENWAVWAGKEIAAGLFSGIPVARDLANAAISGRDYTATPVVSMVQNWGQTAKDIEHAATGQEVSDKWVKHAIQTSGYVFGLPTGQAASTGQFLWDMGNGQQNPTDLAEWYAGVAHGDIRAH